MPAKATELLDNLCVDSKKRSFYFAKLGSDFKYGSDEPIHKDHKLFPRLATED